MKGSDPPSNGTPISSKNLSIPSPPIVPKSVKSSNCFNHNLIDSSHVNVNVTNFFDFLIIGEVEDNLGLDLSFVEEELEEEIEKEVVFSGSGVVEVDAGAVTIVEVEVDLPEKRRNFKE